MLGAIISLGQFIIKEASEWSRRRDTLRQAKLEADVAVIKARTELAAYQVKADMEWDLTWAGQAQTSWKDEYLLILWSIPFVGFLPSLFFPGQRDHVMETLQFLQQIDPNIIAYYLGGWTVIFAATFGLKSIAQAGLPGRVSKVVEAFDKVQDDVPDEAAKAAQGKVSALVGKLKEGLF